MFIGWHGDPCSRCHDRRAQGKVPRPAVMHGMCAQCWHGASEGQRRMALWLEEVDELVATEAAVKAFAAELDAYGTEAA